jgi:ubiquinone biosynthesis protein
VRPARSLVLTGHLLAAAAVAVPEAAVLAVTRGRAAAGRALARRTADAVARLGPTFVKAAQVLGTRRDVLGTTLCDALCALQHSVPAMSAAQRRAALRAAYGDALGEVFTEVAAEPVASGSIACVYRATLRTGGEVAVKLRRPDIAERMAADLALLRRGAGLVARLPALRGTPVRELVGQVCDAVLGQLDFEREAGDLERLRLNLVTVPRVRVPRVHRAACRDTAIVMDLVPGLDAAAAACCGPAERRAFAAATMAVVYQMLFVDGFVHCDLHPGNLYFTASGRVVVLDAGFSVRLEDRMRVLFAEFFLNMSLGRGRRCAEIVLRSARGCRPDADLAAFTDDVEDLVARTVGLAAKEFSLIAFATSLFRLQRRYGVAAAPELVFPLLSLLVVEGSVRDLDPDLDFQAEARPVLTRALFSNPTAAA